MKKRTNPVIKTTSCYATIAFHKQFLCSIWYACSGIWYAYNDATNEICLQHVTLIIIKCIQLLDINKS